MGKGSSTDWGDFLLEVTSMVLIVLSNKVSITSNKVSITEACNTLLPLEQSILCAVNVLHCQCVELETMLCVESIFQLIYYLSSNVYFHSA